MFAATNQKSISTENEQAKRTMKHRGSVGMGIGLNEDDCKHDAQKKRTLRNMLASEHAEEEKGGRERLAVDSATAAYHESF